MPRLRRRILLYKNVSGHHPRNDGLRDCGSTKQACAHSRTTHSHRASIMAGRPPCLLRLASSCVFRPLAVRTRNANQHRKSTPSFSPSERSMPSVPHMDQSFPYSTHGMTLPRFHVQQITLRSSPPRNRHGVTNPIEVRRRPRLQ